MKTKGIKLKGGFHQVTDKDGKTRIEKISGFGLNASAKLAKRKADKTPKLKRTR
jgi:hypothetical protein